MLASAAKGTGVDELRSRIEEHRRHLEERGLIREKRRRVLFSRIRDAFMNRLERRVWENPSLRELIDRRMEEVCEGKLSPYRLVRELERLVAGGAAK